MIAGTLQIDMLTNMARLVADMGESKKIVSGAMSGIESAVASAKSALGALGITLSVGYFAHLIKGSIDAMDHLNDLSKSTNITVETLAGLRVAAKQSGGDLDSIAASINKLSVEMGKSPEKFKALGVSAKDPLQAFKQLSDIFVAIQDPQQRAAVAAAALGKAWAGAAPLLAEGSEKIQQMVDKGTKLAGVTADDAQKADELNDKWVELVGTGGLLNSMVVKILDPLLSLTNQMIAAKEASSGFLGTMTRFFSIGGDQSANPEAALAKVEEKLAALRKTSEDFATMGWFKRMFSADDIAIIKTQIAFLETQKEALTSLVANMPKTAGAKGDGADEAAIAAIIAEEKARRFLGGDDKVDPNEVKKQTAAAQQVIEGIEERDKIIREAHEAEIAGDQALYVEKNKMLIAFYDLQQEEAYKQGADLIQIDVWQTENRKKIQAGFMDFLGNLAGLMNTQSRKVFELGKLGAIGQAGYKGALAVMDAWEAGMSVGGPWAPLVAAGYAAAAGLNALNLINNIRNQKFGGSGGSVPVSAGQGASGILGGGTGSGQPSAADRPTSQTVVNVSITGVVTQDVVDQFKESLTQFFGNDGVLIPAASRQASVIATGV